MPDPKDVRGVVDLEEREERRKLMEELRAYDAQNQIQGYQEYHAKMEELNQIMEEYHALDSWGTLKKVDEAGKKKLTDAIKEAAKAGETYLKNVKKDAQKDDSIGPRKGVPGMVHKLQGLLSKDLTTIEAYDTKGEKSLPVLLEEARSRTINIGAKKMKTVGGQQTSRIPMTVVNAKGEKKRGFFTKANYFKKVSDFQRALDEAIAGAKTEEGKQQLRDFMKNLKEKASKHAGYSDCSDGMALAFIASMYREDNGEIPDASWRDLCRVTKLNSGQIGSGVLKTFRDKLEKLCDVACYQQGQVLKFEDGTRIDQRNSGMSAVAGVLGVSSLIVKSENMKFTDEQGKVIEGTFTDYAKGFELNRDEEGFRYVSDQPFRNMNGHAMKQIADIQVLDYICGNIDRHFGNMSYTFDSSGRLIGIQGFDNDSAFGRFANGGQKTHELPGTGMLNVISKSMRDKVMGLDPAMLKFTLRGYGLSEEELDFAAKRLKDLKEAIIRGENHYRGKENQRTFAGGRAYEYPYLRVLPDDQFRGLHIKQFYRNQGENLFSDVHQWMSITMNQARRHGYRYQAGLNPNEAAVKPLEEIETIDSKYAARELLKSIRGAAKLVKNQAENFDIDGLTSVLHGGSDEFKEMVTAVKRAARLEKSLRDQPHISEEEYRLNRSYMTQTMEKVRETATAYLQKKLEEQGLKTDDLKNIKKLAGKNEYETARIEHAKTILGFATGFQAPPEMDVLSEAEEREMKAAGQLSAIEEAENAKKMLEEIHRKEGLASPDEMKAKGLTQEEFQQQLQQAQENKPPQLL